jgi:hypothetical protein
LLPFALTLIRVAERTLAKGLGNAEKARRLVLSLFFRAVLGIERIFHFETLDDVWFALLTGGHEVLSRTCLGGLVRAVTTRAAQAFTCITERLGALRDQIVTLSLDEHAIARFTRKFRIPKGFHTIRNKWMRIEKVVFLHWPVQRRFLRLVVTRGKAALADLALAFLRAVRARTHPRQIRLILDAAAAKDHASLRRFDRCRKTVFLLRAPRRPAYLKAWKRLPRETFLRVDEPGRYVGAKPKRIEVTETTTPIAGIARPVRTVVVREHAKRGKDRWHALFILHDDTTAPLALVHEFRTRQHHEQAYRIGVHDMALDTVPSGYPKSGSPDRPGFRQGPLLLCGWVDALACNALLEFGAALPAAFHRAHPRTLRRWALVRDAELLVTPSHLLVVLESVHHRTWLRPLMQKLNEANVSLPWFGGRRVAVGFAASCPRADDARPVLSKISEVGSDCGGIAGGVWC